MKVTPTHLAFTYSELTMETLEQDVKYLKYIFSKLTTKTPERRHWHRSAFFIINFERISHLVLLFLLLTLNM